MSARRIPASLISSSSTPDRPSPSSAFSNVVVHSRLPRWGHNSEVEDHPRRVADHPDQPARPPTRKLGGLGSAEEGFGDGLGANCGRGTGGRRCDAYGWPIALLRRRFVHYRGDLAEQDGQHVVQHERSCSGGESRSGTTSSASPIE